MSGELKCPICEKQHSPNGTQAGEYGGMPIVIDCRLPPAIAFCFTDQPFQPIEGDEE